LIVSNPSPWLAIRGYLLINPNGSKLWRWKYRYVGKERKPSFGPYPEVSLKEARVARDLARERLRQGKSLPRNAAPPLVEITTHELSMTLKKFERLEQFETTNRLRSLASRVFATARTEQNPAAILRGALITPTAKHHAAIIDPKQVGQLLRDIDDYSGCSPYATLLRLLRARRAACLT
jgi:integrase